MFCFAFPVSVCLSVFPSVYWSVCWPKICLIHFCLPTNYVFHHFIPFAGSTFSTKAHVYIPTHRYWGWHTLTIYLNLCKCPVFLYIPIFCVCLCISTTVFLVKFLWDQQQLILWGHILPLWFYNDAINGFWGFVWVYLSLTICYLAFWFPYTTARSQPTASE